MIYHISYYISNANGSEYIVARFWYWASSKLVNKSPIVITSPHSSRLLEREMNAIRYIKFEGPIYWLLSKFLDEVNFQRIFFFIWHIELQLYFVLRWASASSRRRLSGTVLHFITPVQGYLPIFFFRLVPVKVIYGPKYFFDSALQYNDIILRAKKFISHYFKGVYIYYISLIKKKNDVFIVNDLAKLHTHSGLPYYIADENFDGLLPGNVKRKQLVLASGRDVPIKMIEQIHNVFKTIAPIFPNLKFLLLTDNKNLYCSHSNYQCDKLLSRKDFINLSRSAFVYYALTSEQGGVAQIEQILMGNPVVCSSVSAINKFAMPSESFKIEASVTSNTTKLSSLLASLLAEDINYFTNECTKQRANIFKTCGIDSVSDLMLNEYR